MKNFNFFEKLWEHSRTLRRVGLVLVMCLITITQMWASVPHFHLTGAPSIGSWSNSATEWKLSSPASSALSNGATFDEYCTYMWLSEGDYFGLNNGSRRYSRNDYYDVEIKEGDGSGVYGYPADASHTDKSFHYVGATGLVRINAAQTGSGNSYGNQGEWYPYIWIEESLETAILTGSKIMFYFGIADSWNTNWFYLSKEGDQNNNKSYKAYYSTATKLNTRIAVAYVDANTTYYIASAQSGGTCIKMSSNAAAGNLYSLNSSGGNNIYVNTGNVPHFATTSVTKAKGTEASTIAATAANSIFGNAFTYHYYYTTDGGSTFTKFDPTDISDLASGTYTVYALGWDGHILVRSDNSVTLKITVPITLNANGGVDGAVTSVNAVNGDAASGGNIAGGSLPTKTNYVFTGFYTSGGTKVINADGEWISNVSGYTDASGNWTCTAGSTLYAHWEDQWNLKGSWDEWGTYKGMPYVSSNTYRVTLELSAGTYDFKVVKRTRGSSDVYYGKESTTFTRPTITSAKGLVTTGGATYNLHVTADIAGDYVFTYVYDADNDNMKVYVKYPCFTDPAGGTIFYLNMESSLKPGSAVKAPTAADASHPGLLDLISYASIANGVAYVGNKSTSSQYGSVTTTPKIKLNNDENSFVLIQLDCALKTGDKITVSTNNDVYVTTSSTRATTYTISKSATYVCPAAFNSATSVYLWRKSNDAEISDITIERCSNPAAPTAFSTSNVMATTATFSITDAADAESYDLYYASGSPSAPTSGTTATENVTTKTPTITGLSASTTYNIWVRSVCDANHKSSWYALSGNTFKTADFEITDGGKNNSGTPKWSDKSNGNAIVNTDIDGIITGGTVVYSGTGTLTGNDTHGIIFDNDNDELTITVTGMVLPVGAVITIVQHGNSSTSKATGFKISGNSMSPETCNNGSTNYKEMTQTYTVVADDGVAGKNNFKIKWTGTNQVFLKSMKVTGCEEASCTTPTSLSISGDTEYAALEDISLTASASGTDASTTYTWYKGANWATASAADPVQATATGSSGYTLTIDDCTTSDAGTYWCLISNGDDCDDKVSETITVSCLTAPSAVSSLSCSTHTTNSLTYTWTKASNASGYVAKLWDNSTCTGDAVASETLGDVATVEFSSLTPGTTYYCKVQSKGNGTVYCEDGGTTDAASGSTDSPSISAFSPTSGTTVKSGTTVTITGSSSSTIYYLWSTSSAPANAAAVVSGGTAGTSGAATVTTTGISSSNTYLYAVASEGGVNSTISSASYTIDDTKPTLSSSDPANSATGVNTSGTIVLTFSEALSAVDGTKFTLTNATMGAVAIDGSDNTKVNIAYSGASYSATVTLASAAGAVTDAVGNTSAALSSISFTIKAAPSQSALVSGTLYEVPDMIPEGESLTSDDQFFDGLSANTKFTLIGSGSGKTTPKVNNASKNDKTINSITFDDGSMWFKGEASLTSNIPTTFGLSFMVASAGKLYLYFDDDDSSTNIKLAKSGSSGSNPTVSSGYSVVDVTSGTYYMYGTGTTSPYSFYGIKFDKAPELSSSSPADGDTDVPVSGTIVLTFDESISSVTAAKFSLSTGSISAVAVDGSDDTKVNITYSGLPGSTEVTLSVAAGAVTDAAGNTSAALSGITFTTVATGYAITNGSPTGGTIAITDGLSDITEAEEDATVYITATPSDGYSFSSWSVAEDDSGDPVSVTSSTTNPTTFTMPAADVTVSATFSPNTYDITYHENGASYKAGYTAPATYTVGTGATLPVAGDMINTGYTFGGWFADDGLETGGVKTEVGTSEYGNKEFWAKWTENTYTITYNANGDGAGNVGDATGSTSSTNGHYVTVADNGFALEDHVFAGWNTAANGSGDSYGEGDEIELTGNMTLYAIWATDYDISWGNAQYGGADETPNLGGGNYTITASVATWTGTLTTDMISAVSDGVMITNVAVDNSASPKTITATFDVGASVAGTTIKLQLDVPAYGVYGAKSSEKSITIDRCSGGGGASTVVFSQNFSSVGAGSVDYAANTAREYKSGGTTITGIVGSGTNEFTYIGQAQKDKCGVAVNSSTGGNSVNATGMFQAYCNNTGGKYALVKNSDFAATAPTALKVSMKIWFQQGSSGSDYSVTFAVGDGFSNSTSAPDATNVHSGFSILNNSNACLYPYKSNKTALSGTNKLTQGSDLTMVWVINNSGQTLSYTDPASNTSTLANDKFDVWIGTTRFIAGASATTASKALQDLYIGDPAGKNHQLRLDDIVVTDISPAVSSITPTLTWDDGDLDIASVGVTKEEGDADFTFTASQNKNSLGAITYSSSNTSVATVNASGKVHIVGNGSTTITASIAESGCYKDADVSYSLTVNEKACADAAGTIKDNDGNTIAGNAITKSSCETVTLKLVGYTDGANIQWYKDGEAIDGATAASYTVPTSGSGVYSAISSKTCDRNSTNEITVTNSASVSATKIVDSWYVKAGRRTPDIALVQTMDAASFQVKISSTVIWSTVSGSEVTTGLGGCGFYLGKDGIIYLKGTKSNGNATDDILENKTLSFVVTNACGTNASDPGNITIKRQAATGRPSVAYVSLGTKGGAVTDTTAGYYKTAALYKYLDHTLSDGDFDLTASNVYWSVNEKELKEHYSQFDAILITDDPSTKTVPSGVSGDGAYKTKGYVNALGCLVDIRPILTMEAYVSALANWKTKGINGDPTSPNPRQYSMKLQCKDHEIFGSLSVGDNVVQTTVDGTNYWSVKMVDNTKSPYSGLADDEKTSGKGSIPALQGFAASDVSGLLLLGQISDGAYHAGVERQEEPAARLMLLGLNNQALPNALTQEGKIVIKNALTYLLKTNMEEVDDCSNYFTGATSTDWNTPSNWFKGVVPNSPMVRARILAPCEITGITVKAAQIDIVTSGTSSKKAGELTGKLTINPTGALIVGGKIRAAEAPYYSIEDLKPTEEEDLVLNTNSSNQAALIFDNEDGDTKATVNLYSLGRKESGSYYYQYMAVPMESLPVNPSFAGSGIYTYVWNEASGWERRGYYTDLYAFEGVGITTKFADSKTYEMKGTLASTETREIALTNDKNGQNMIGNSWTAPIQIADLEEDNSASEITQTVYIYSTGNGNTVSGGTTASDGQWLAIPFSAAGFEAWDGLKVIPAMQTFNINVTGTSTLTLDYDKVVRKRAAKMSVDTLTTPLHAPKRSAAHEGVELMRIRVEDSQTHTDLYLFKGERFSDEFDNGWEAEYLNGDGRSAKLYAQTEIGKMAVVATDELEGMVLGFEPGKETEYTFTFGGEGMGYYLNDLKLKKSTWINAGETYSFTYEEGDINRFIISTTPIATIMTGCESVGAEAAKVRKVIIDDKVYIIRIGHMYSVDGQMVK